MVNYASESAGVGETYVDHEVAIIGMGFAGIVMAHHLDELGLTDFVLLEKVEKVGGTWRESHYPGARCDVPAVLYSLLFAPEWGWTSNYPPQREILAYMMRTAERQGVTLCMRFNTEVFKAEFDSARGIRTLHDADGMLATCRTLISAESQLNHPAMPGSRGWTATRARLSIPRSGATRLSSRGAPWRWSAPGRARSRSSRPSSPKWRSCSCCSVRRLGCFSTPSNCSRSAKPSMSSSKPASVPRTSSSPRRSKTWMTPTCSWCTGQISRRTTRSSACSNLRRSTSRAMSRASRLLGAASSA